MPAPSPVAASLARLCTAWPVAAMRSGQGYLSQGHLSSPGSVQLPSIHGGPVGRRHCAEARWGGQSEPTSSQSALPVFKSWSLSQPVLAGREAGSDGRERGGSHVGWWSHRPGVGGKRGQLSQSSCLGRRGHGQRRHCLTPFATPARFQ